MTFEIVPFYHRSILSQEELNVEGLVDLMTLNYTDHDPSADGSRFALALELYYRAREALPLHRREACIKTILRRTLLASW